jgi:predicted transcriptional regulator
MPEDEARVVIEKALETSGKTIAQEAMQKILDYSEKFPHLIQELSYSAFEVSKSDEITVTDVKAGIHGSDFYEGSISRLGKLFFSKMYQDIQKSDNFKEILKIIAVQSGQKQKWVARQDILSEFSGKRGSLDSSIRTLKDKELIITNPDSQGQYRIVSKMFQAYVENLL